MDEQPPVSTVPEGLPVLSAGRHRSPDRGSCVMECVSVLAGESWSDRPRCTDRVLAELAWRVNDDIRAASRPALAQLAPRLVGAVGPEPLGEVVVLAIAEIVLDLAPGDAVAVAARRRAALRLARRRRPSRGRAIVRAILGSGLDEAYLRLRGAVAGLEPAERDAVRIRALRVATEAVRRHVGASDTAHPTDHPTDPSRRPTVVPTSRA